MKTKLFILLFILSLLILSSCNNQNNQTKQGNDSSKESVVHCEHCYDEWVEIQKPTCTEEGKKQTKCILCGIIQEKTISPTGHNFQITICPISSCQEDKTKVETCRNCQEKRYTVIPKQQHGWKPILTCEGNTLIISSNCNTCGSTIDSAFHYILTDKLCESNGVIATVEREIVHFSPSGDPLRTFETKGPYFVLLVIQNKLIVFKSDTYITPFEQSGVDAKYNPPRDYYLRHGALVLDEFAFQIDSNGNLTK